MATTIQKILKPSKYRAVDTSTSEQIVGEQLLEDPSFDVDVAQPSGNGVAVVGSHWQITDLDIEITGGKAVWTAYSGTGNRELKDRSTGPFLPVTDRYRVTIVVSDYTSGELMFNSGSYNTGYVINSAGTFTFDFSPETGSGNFHIKASNNDGDGTEDAVLSVSEVSVYKLESFGNNNHGQIYSGRALEFDGVSDYLSVSSDFASTVFGSYLKTFACWFKTDNSATEQIISAGWLSALTIGIKNQKIQVASFDNGDDIKAPTILQNNTWYRLVVTSDIDHSDSTAVDAAYADGFSNYDVYINGIKQTMEAGDAFYRTAGDMLLGARYYNSYSLFFSGAMSDVQGWNKVWTQSDATYDYNNPESLALSNGGTSLTESNLKLWYPMQDGHRGQQSYVLDGAGTGLGPELISDISASAWTKGFATDGGSVDASTTITDNADGSVTFETAEASDWQTVSVPFVNENGVTYKISITGEALAETDGDNDDKFYWRVGSTANNGHNTDNINSSFMISEGAHTETNYFESNVSTGTAYFIGMFKKASNTVHKFRLDSVSIKAVNQKHHATTVFLGDDLFDAGVGDYSDSTGGWTAEANNTVDNNDSALRITFVDDDDGARLDLNDAEDLTTDLTVGRTYRLSFEYKINQVTGSNVILQINTGTNSFVSSSALTDTSFSGTPVTKDFVATHATGAEIKFNNMDSGDILHLKNFTLKEVGVASGWTDADQQLDIAQTALQSYNQLAWFDGQNDYCSISDNPAFTFGTGGTNDSAMSISAWIYMNDATSFSIMGKYGSSNKEWLFDVETNDKLRFQAYDQSANTYIGRKYNTALTSKEGQWLHVVATYSGNEASSGISLYINGESVDDTDYESGTYAGMEDLTSNIFIGGNQAGGKYANGCITETSIWVHELTNAEVQELYNDGKALHPETHSAYLNDTSKLQGYWRNNGLSTWTDLSTAFDRHGTPTNTSETLLLPAGVESSRCTQGFYMNTQRLTNSLNLTSFAEDDPSSFITEHDHVKCINFHPSNNYDVFSICGWVKAKHISENGFLIDNRYDADTGWVVFANDTSGNFKFKIGDGTDAVTIDSGATLTLDTWHHLAVTYSGNAGTIKMYFDGVCKIVNGTATNVAVLTSLSNLENIQTVIGGRSFGDVENGFHGHIDDVLYYNKVLSDGGVSDEATAKGEIARIYNAGKRSHR